MREKIRPRCQAFLGGFLGLFLTAQCFLGVCYWLGNVTRAQQFDTVSVMGRWVSGLPVLPVHVVQTAAVFGGLFYLLDCFFRGWRRAFFSLAALTIPFVMQVCLSETEHGAALTAILCMAGVIADCHIGHHRPDRIQEVICGGCAGILLLCGAAYSGAAALLFLVLSLVRIRASEKKGKNDISENGEETVSFEKTETSAVPCSSKKTGALRLFAALLIGAGLALTGIIIQNKINPDRMQITWESVLLKRFAYPGLNENLMEGLPQEMQDMYTRSEINSFRLYPYLLDTTLESDLLEAVEEERTREIYLELAWYGFLCGTKVDMRMILEDAACYLSPQLMYSFYSDGTILAEYGWGYQQFLSGTPYLAEAYMDLSLLGYAVGLALTLVCRLVCGPVRGSVGTGTLCDDCGGGHKRPVRGHDGSRVLCDDCHSENREYLVRDEVGNAAFRKRFWPLIILWAGLSVLFVMRGAAVFNYKYAAFQAILGYLPLMEAAAEAKRAESSTFTCEDAPAETV
ncbi:MAG: hypothetical protein LUC90_12410 [Lachnospiraceae bacterium]|nr:hypothetical protein [Lachnospiraceae bacterium]